MRRWGTRPARASLRSQATGTPSRAAASAARNASLGVSLPVWSAVGVLGIGSRIRAPLGVLHLGSPGLHQRFDVVGVEADLTIR